MMMIRDGFALYTTRNSSRMNSVLFSHCDKEFHEVTMT